jgi:hypothetical protein
MTSLQKNAEKEHDGDNEGGENEEEDVVMEE